MKMLIKRLGGDGDDVGEIKVDEKGNVYDDGQVSINIKLKKVHCDVKFIA